MNWRPGDVGRVLACCVLFVLGWWGLFGPDRDEITYRLHVPLWAASIVLLPASVYAMYRTIRDVRNRDR